MDIIRFLILATITVLPFSSNADAEIIGSSRRVDWSNAGYPGTIPEVTNIINIKNHGAIGDGSTYEDLALSMALSVAPNPTVLFFPAGTYKFRSTIQIPQGIVLRGEGADKTHLEFDLGGAAVNCIEILTYQRGTFTNVVAGYQKGSTSLTVDDGNLFRPGNTAEIEQSNDPAIMYTKPEWNLSWAQNVVGQFFKIIEVNGNMLTIDRPLHITFRADLTPQVRTNELITNVGIEDVHIKRLDSGDGHTILFKNAADCWVRRIESEDAFRAHIYIDSSMNIEIRDSYFHHAHDYGGGGHGYGVDCSRHATDCLFENNIFRHLRHAMLIHVGANGNVFGYNYSLEPLRTDGPWPSPDISVHGHYPFMNLFEGNIVQQVEITDWFGPAGEGNTFFRNRVETEGIHLADKSHRQNIIGNELTNDSKSIVVDNGINETLIHGNNVNCQTTWDPTIADHTLVNSFYLSAKPDFLRNTEWPSIGGDKIPDRGSIPAKDRYESGSFFPNTSQDGSNSSPGGESESGGGGAGADTAAGGGGGGGCFIHVSSILPLFKFIHKTAF